MPIIPNDLNFLGLRSVQNEELMHPTNVDSRQNLMYFPRNAENKAKPDGILATLNEVQELSDLISRDRKPVLRDQRKQPGVDPVEPCGRYHRNDYNMLTDIIGKMSPEARNALIDALLKTLIDKPKITAVKSGDARDLQHHLDAAMEPPLRVNNKPNTLVQPFSLTVQREKAKDLYKYLNNEKLQEGLKKANFTVDLGDLIQDSVKKDGGQCSTTKKCHKQSTTKKPTSSTQEEDDDGADDCCDQDSDQPGSAGDVAGGKVVNLTQVFNVHPKLLIVNSGQFAPTDIAGLLNDPHPQSSPGPPTSCNCLTTVGNQPNASRAHETSSAQPGPARGRMTSKFPKGRKRCTRRYNRHGHMNRHDRRQHANLINNLVYTYYMDMDDPRAGSD